MTGATSFTGAYIAKAYHDAGHVVYAAITRKKDVYVSPEYQKRMTLCAGVKWLENLSFGSPAFLEFIEKEKPQIIVNHGAPIENYRSPDFDFIKSVESSLFQVRKVFETLKANQCDRFIHTGTVFEPNDQRPAASIYGVSKRMVWDVIRFYSESQKIPLVKIEIPNPIGPLENSSRLIPVFCDKWKKGETAILGAPNAVSDHLPANWLARSYVDALDAKIIGGHRILSPSGFVLSNQELVELFLNFAKRQKLFLNAKVEIQNQNAPATIRQNLEARPELEDEAEVLSFFNQYVASMA